MSLDNKVALVTGGTGGIGTAICQALFQAGCLVVAAYNTEKKGEAWQKSQKSAGFNFQIAHVDVTDYDSCTKMIKQIEQKTGPIDIVVNNAGITSDVQLRKMTEQQWQQVLHTNLDSIFNVTQQIINGMIERSFGRIINISSINGQKGQFGQCNYAAAKAGLHGFTKSLAQEVARKGITVNTISPGYIGTDMVMALSEEVRHKIISQIPIGRLGKPEEVARLVAFLVAEESSFITGADFSINGGQYMC